MLRHLILLSVMAAISACADVSKVCGVSSEGCDGGDECSITCYLSGGGTSYLQVGCPSSALCEQIRGENPAMYAPVYVTYADGGTCTVYPTCVGSIPHLSVCPPNVTCQ
jgi:hypothetical protein